MIIHTFNVCGNNYSHIDVFANNYSHIDVCENNYSHNECVWKQLFTHWGWYDSLDLF